MNQKLLTSAGADRAVLLFLGWGMDAAPFATVAAEGYDVVAVWDYRDDSFDESVLAPYGEIVVAAWSLGVLMASRFIASHPGLNVTRKIAFNGTLFPADTDRGIAPAIYEATRAGLTDRSLRKFYRRMFTSAEAFAPFAAATPCRPVDDLVDELDRIRRVQERETVPAVRWDIAVVAGDDRIIPPEAQTRSWEEGRRAYHIERRPGAGHFVDFNAELRRLVVDKDLIARRFGGSRPTYCDNANVQRLVADRLAAMIEETGVAPRSVLEIGAGTGILTRRLAVLYPEAAITAVDLVRPTMLETLSPRVSAVEADAERFVGGLAEGSVDLLATASTIQWFNSIPSFLTRCLRVIANGGVLAAATYGDRNFEELDRVGAVRPRFASLDSLRAMVPDGFEIVADAEETVEMKFDSPSELLRHIHVTGVNASARGNSGEAVVAARRILRDYPLDPDGRATLTFNPLYLILKRK